MPSWASSADLKPSQIFAADSPSIVVVVAYGEGGKAIAQGSGVVIAKDTVVSNCHVIEKADTAGVLYQSKRFAATLRYADFERDLCSFTVKNLSATPVRMGFTSQVQVGDAAYAIGAPEGLDLTLSGGLISSLRKIPGGVVLQMTTPISPGSSGGGLFDSQGRLIGITSYYMAKGEQLNFALPVEWVRELPQRGKLASTNTSDHARIVDPAQKSSMQEGIRALQAGDYSTALALFEPLAMQGNAEAQYQLGGMYALGQGVPLDHARYLAWTRKAAEQGYAPAQSSLGLEYEVGVNGFQRDYAKAVVWFRKAAKQGDVIAQDNLGDLYENGHGVPQDYRQAIAWYRKAAAKGDAEAQESLGDMYANGQGESRDYAQAASWYGKAAQQPVLGMVAQIKLGELYQAGLGVPQSYQEAAWLYREAVQNGSLGWAQCDLGLSYEMGQGVPQNFVVAYALFNYVSAFELSHVKPSIKFRNKLTGLMTPVQIQAGQALTLQMQRIGVIKALDKYLNGA
ncbi:MAG TPA: bifunctional trypsin-like peptidase domain-containing/SEL1-like repeat protein, partial [Candidatus Saccharimonadales bacterium]|nr:bifunctional trypsin-like peptidase domain-containing/SEL1-like repeat protein [Candidatus Saccharimonadales bacterium]